MIYVVGNEQNYHFQVLSILLDKLGFAFGKGLIHFAIRSGPDGIGRRRGANAASPGPVGRD